MKVWWTGELDLTVRCVAGMEKTSVVGVPESITPCTRTISSNGPIFTSQLIPCARDAMYIPAMQVLEEAGGISELASAKEALSEHSHDFDSVPITT